MKSFSMCIVGSGPSAFYVADAFRKLFVKCLAELPTSEGRTPLELRVDMIERLPTPYGLVRYGVAPDHIEIKKVTNKFEEMAGDYVNWVGNVTVGKDISFDELCTMYDVVLLSTGADVPRSLHIPGENGENVLYAKDIVDWYNSNPLSISRDIVEKRLQNAKNIIVIGHGNVGLDICRILCSDPSKLSHTDIDERSLAVIRKMNLKKISLVARRGIIDSKFTVKELREVFHMDSLSVHMPAFDYELEKIPLPKRRLLTLLKEASCGMYIKPNAKYSVEFVYAKRPFDIRPGCMIFRDRFIENSLLVNERAPLGGIVRWTETEKTESMGCDLVVVSTGFTPHKIPGILYDEDGNVSTSGAKIRNFKNAYVSGWAKSGSQGEIAWTIRDAMQTAMQIMRDSSQTIHQRFSSDRDTGKSDLKLAELLHKRSIKFVNFDEGWKVIQEKEAAQGASLGKKAKKMVSIELMMKEIGISAS